MSTFNKQEFLERILVQEDGTPLCKGQFVNIDGVEYKITYINKDINSSYRINDVIHIVLVVIALKTEYNKDSTFEEYISITSSNYFKGYYDLSDRKELGNLKFISIPNMTDETFFKTIEYIPFDCSNCIPSRDK